MNCPYKGFKTRLCNYRRYLFIICYLILMNEEFGNEEFGNKDEYNH
jgi:hypothetical protein